MLQQLANKNESDEDNKPELNLNHVVEPILSDLNNDDTVSLNTTSV